MSVDPGAQADVDRTALLPALRAIFAKGALAADAVAKAELAAGGGRSMATRRAQFTEVSRDLNHIFYSFPFAVPECVIPSPSALPANSAVVPY